MRAATAPRNAAANFISPRAGTAIEHLADDRELTRIGEALDELAKADPALAEIVDMKFFCGFTFAEIAAMKEISERTAQRQWEKARNYFIAKFRRIWRHKGDV